MSSSIWETGDLSITNLVIYSLFAFIVIVSYSNFLLKMLILFLEYMKICSRKYIFLF